jgi:putative FmdB family regulatory protein
MPIYEYQCQKCRHVCEVLQKAKDKPPEKCPKCGGAVVKLVSSPAIQFKGNGWYITDYAKKNAPSASAKAGTKPAADPCSGEGTKAKSDKSSE